MQLGKIVLVVGKQPQSLEVITQRLRSRGYKVAAVSDVCECIQWLDINRCAIVLLCVDSGSASGISTLKLIRRSWSLDAMPIVVRHDADPHFAVEAFEAGASDCVDQTVQDLELLARIDSCLQLKASFTQLVEDERERVLKLSLVKSAARVARPMERLVDSLEAAFEFIEQNELPDLVLLHLNKILESVEQLVDATDQIRGLGTRQHFGYQGLLNELQLSARLSTNQLPDDSAGGEGPRYEMGGRAA